ncbi:MAG: DedA family protein [Leptolyngbyaceae cyanobacterium]
MTEWITGTMESLGYWGIGLLMLLENLFPPIPSELIMPLAGFTAAQGKMNFLLAVLAGVIGTIVGALPWYYAGVKLDNRHLHRLADRYGKWLTISSKDIDKANDWFYKKGAKAVLLGRLVPGVRTVISLPAGMSRMPLLPFLLYSTVGTTLWVLALTAAGYLLGANYKLVDGYVGILSKLVVVLIVAGLAAFVLRRKRRSRMARR